MYHERTVKGSAARARGALGVLAVGALGALALAGAGLIGLAGAAAAATSAGGMPADYTCSLAGYGQGLAPLTIPAAVSATSNGSTVAVQLATQPVQLPTATASALAGLNYLDVSAVAPASGMAGNTVSLGGHSGALGNGPLGNGQGMTSLPGLTAAGSATEMGAGAGSVGVPQTMTLTPVGTSQQAPVTCTTSSTASVQVTVAAPAAGATTAGQPYTCTVAVGTSTATVSKVPMMLTATGPSTVGMPDTVTMSSPASALGSGFPASATPMSVSGTASVGGTSPASVPLTGLADGGNGMFRMSGQWTPQAMGMARITAPHRFAARLREQTQVTVAVSCTAATATTSTTQVMVQAATASAAAPALASASAAASAPTSGAAPGAPNTGGGGSLHGAGDLPLAAGGAAAGCAGLAITYYALRRRRGLSG